MSAIKLPLETASLRNEAINALIHLCRQNPIKALLWAEIWLVDIIHLCVNPVASTRNKAEHLLGFLVTVIPGKSVVC
jgi:hypothetical protein